jgi:chromatin structure-remodeling complex subunit RSC1/2
MPSTEAAQNDGSHLTAAQWEGMQKVLNHIYDYRTEEYVDMRLLARDAILTFR